MNVMGFIREPKRFIQRVIRTSKRQGQIITIEKKGDFKKFVLFII